MTEQMYAFNEEHLQNKHIVVVGDVMLDVFYHGAVTKFTPDAPIPVVHVQHIEQRLGGAGNVARNLASLAVQTSLISLVGKDEHGHILQDLLDAEHIHHQLIQTEAPTVTKVNIVGGNGSGESHKMLRLDFEATPQNSEPAYVTQIVQALQAMQFPIDGIILSDYLKGTCTSSVCTQIIQYARAHNIPVLVDPKSTDWHKYAYATCIKPNLAELSQALGVSAPADREMLIESGQQLVSKWHIDHLIVSQSAQGVTHISSTDWQHFPSSGAAIVDVIGAGDAMIATLAVGMAFDLNIDTALAIANDAAGIVCGKSGTAPITLTELQRRSLEKETPKLITLTQLRDILSAIRANQRRIVFTNGCFDILHRGHIEHLKQAKGCGDILVIGVNSDESIRRIKGRGRPYNTFHDRAALLQSLEHVDYILEFTEDTPCHLLDIIRPDVLIKGGNYTPDEVVGKEYAKTVNVLPFLQGYSTSHIVDAIRKEHL